VAHLVNLGNELIKDLVILEPYFEYRDIRGTGLEAENLYTAWMQEMLVEHVNIISDTDEGKIH